MGFEVQSRAIETDSGPCRVLVATPRSHMRVGADRLAVLRGGMETSTVDVDLVAQVKHLLRGDDGHAVFLMRGQSPDGSGSWDFDPTLAEHERSELGRLLFRSHLPTYRAMVEAGVFAYIYADWPRAPLDSFRMAMDLLRDELDWQRRNDSLPFAEVDYWIVSNLIFHFGLDAEHVIQRLLPAKLGLLRPRAERIRQMLDRVAAAA